MKFGVNTFIWAAEFGPNQVPLLERIKAAGFDSVEVPLFHPYDYVNPGVEHALTSSGLDRTVCSVIPAHLSLLSDDDGVRGRTLDHLRACIETCRDLGAKLMAGPLYAPVGYLPGRRRTPEEWTRVVDAYQSLAPDLERAGVSIAIEPLNRYETYFLNTAADAFQLAADIAHPNVGILFDTYHANIEEKSLPEAIRRLAPHLLHFHSCENDRGIPGTGQIHWTEVFRTLRAIGYNRSLTIESFGFSVGALSAAASIWRDLAPSAEDIAFQGLRFLKSQ